MDSRRSDTRRGEQRPSRRAPARRRRAGRPGIAVGAMTLAVLVVVGILAAQANGTQPNSQQATQPTATAHGKASTSTAPNPNALPANSGSGVRIVYSISGKRVWLVSSSNAVQNTFPMVPGTETPATGTYTVTSRVSSLTGGDGTQVVYVVLFGDSYGFDAEARVTGMPDPPTNPTKGIRTSQNNALTIWNFAAQGMSIVVVA